MDDCPYLHYCIKYDVKYLEPQVDGKVKAVIQDIQPGHVTLTVGGILTAII